MKLTRIPTLIAGMSLIAASILPPEILRAETGTYQDASSNVDATVDLNASSQSHVNVWQDALDAANSVLQHAHVGNDATSDLLGEFNIGSDNASSAEQDASNDDQVNLQADAESNTDADIWINSIGLLNNTDEFLQDAGDTWQWNQDMHGGIDTETNVDVNIDSFSQTIFTITEMFNETWTDDNHLPSFCRSSRSSSSSSASSRSSFPCFIFCHSSSSSHQGGGGGSSHYSSSSSSSSSLPSSVSSIASSESSSSSAPHVGSDTDNDADNGGGGGGGGGGGRRPPASSSSEPSGGGGGGGPSNGGGNGGGGGGPGGGGPGGAVPPPSQGGGPAPAPQMPTGLPPAGGPAPLANAHAMANTLLSLTYVRKEELMF